MTTRCSAFRRILLSLAYSVNLGGLASNARAYHSEPRQLRRNSAILHRSSDLGGRRSASTTPAVRPRGSQRSPRAVSYCRAPHTKKATSARFSKTALRSQRKLFSFFPFRSGLSISPLLNESLLPTSPKTLNSKTKRQGSSMRMSDLVPPVPVLPTSRAVGASGEPLMSQSSPVRGDPSRRVQPACSKALIIATLTLPSWSKARGSSAATSAASSATSIRARLGSDMGCDALPTTDVSDCRRQGPRSVKGTSELQPRIERRSGPALDQRGSASFSCWANRQEIQRDFRVSERRNIRLEYLAGLVEVFEERLQH